MSCSGRTWKESDGSELVIGGETGCSGAMPGAVEDQSRTEPEQAGARVVVDNLVVVPFGTEADNLRSSIASPRCFTFQLQSAGI